MTARGSVLGLSRRWHFIPPKARRRDSSTLHHRVLRRGRILGVERHRLFVGCRRETSRRCGARSRVLGVEGNGRLVGCTLRPTELKRGKRGVWLERLARVGGLFPTATESHKRGTQDHDCDHHNHNNEEPSAATTACAVAGAHGLAWSSRWTRHLCRGGHTGWIQRRCQRDLSHRWTGGCPEWVDIRWGRSNRCHRCRSHGGRRRTSGGSRDRCSGQCGRL